MLYIVVARFNVITTDEYMKFNLKKIDMKKFKYRCLTLLQFFEGEMMCENIEKCRIELQKKYHSVIECYEVF